MMALNLRSGVKIYDDEWFVRLDLPEEASADWLAGLGFTYVLAQSHHLPMADSAVRSSVREVERERHAQLDDLRFRRLLAERDIGHVAVLNLCFDPAWSAAPDLCVRWPRQPSCPWASHEVDGCGAIPSR